MLLVGLAASIAAFRRSPDGGRTGAAPPSVSDSGRSTAQDGGRRLFCFAMQSRTSGISAAKPAGRVAVRRRKIAAGRRCGPGPLAVRSPFGRPRARPFSGRERSPGTDAVTDLGDRCRTHRSGQDSLIRNRRTSSGASWTRKAARSSTAPSRQRSSLKSPSAGDNVSASIPADCARSVKMAAAK